MCLDNFQESFVKLCETELNQLLINGQVEILHALKRDGVMKCLDVVQRVGNVCVKEIIYSI